MTQQLSQNKQYFNSTECQLNPTITLFTTIYCRVNHFWVLIGSMPEHLFDLKYGRVFFGLSDDYGNCGSCHGAVEVGSKCVYVVANSSPTEQFALFCAPCGENIQSYKGCIEKLHVLCFCCIMSYWCVHKLKRIRECHIK